MGRSSKKGLIVFNWTFFDENEEISEHDRAIQLLNALKEREKQMEIVECCGVPGKNCIRTKYSKKKSNNSDKKN